MFTKQPSILIYLSGILIITFLFLFSPYFILSNKSVNQSIVIKFKLIEGVKYYELIFFTISDKKDQKPIVQKTKSTPFTKKN